MALEAGQTVAGLQGTYRIEAKHGQGSFGITYRARAESDGGRVIVKELRIEKLDDWKALEMFEREGRVLSSLSHPNIPAFRDFFAHGGPSPLPVGALSTYAGPEHLSLVLVQQFIEGRRCRTASTPPSVCHPTRPRRSFALFSRPSTTFTTARPRLSIATSSRATSS